MLKLTVAEAAKITGTQDVSKPDTAITALCSLEEAHEGGLCYLTSLEKADLLKDLKASALIVPESAKGQDIPFNGALLYAKNPEWAFILLMKYADAQKQKHTSGIHPTAVISGSAKLGANVSVGAYTVIEDGAQIGDNTVIFPQCYIGKNVSVGKNCYIYPQVVIREECVLKDYVILQAGAKIGSDGFGFTFHDGRHQKIPQIGNVVLGNDVEVQSNTCIDRAKISSTVIGDNTKIDNLVQIGHNVHVGMSSIMCAQVGVARHDGNRQRGHFGRPSGSGRTYVHRRPRPGRRTIRRNVIYSRRTNLFRLSGYAPTRGFQIAGYFAQTARNAQRI